MKAIYSRSLKSAEAVSADLPSADDVTLYSDDFPGNEKRNFADLLERRDIKAVIIALPIVVQPTFIRQALSAGKHVLAEKPLAKDVATGKELIDFYHSLPQPEGDASPVTFGIAEQFRYLPPFLYAAERIRSMGRVLGFRHRLGASVQPGAKYFETPWRKTPEYQGGFLLDGGVHFIAGLRVLLRGDSEGGGRVARTSAFTAQLQPHLPPVDTVDATMQLVNGATGTFSLSFGTTFTGAEWSVACEGGTVSVSGSTVTIKPASGGEEEVVEKSDELGAVKREVFAWAQGLVEDMEEGRQRPEEALADLEVLEGMLRSGEAGGGVVELRYQV